jgi:hypothetical protein
MLEILSFLGGGLFRLAPEFMKIWDRKNERAHEIAMLDKNLEVEKHRSTAAAQKAEIEQRGALAVQEIQAMIEALKGQFTPTPTTGIKWLDIWNGIWDGLSKSVRPVLTYWYCIIAYGTYKAALFTMLIKRDFEWDNAILQLWTSQDHQVMWSIIGFWFVDRALKYVGK